MTTTKKPIRVSILNGYGFLRAKLIFGDGRVTQIGSSAGPDAYREMEQRVRDWADEHGYTAELFAGSGTLSPRS